MGKIGELWALMRPQQWYKNLVVFLPIIFALELHDTGKLVITILAFISLALISSSNYILNDLADVESDRKHPEKKERPLASGRVGKTEALLLFAAAWCASLLLAAKLSVLFMYCVLFLFISTQAYTFWLKNVIFADIIAISTNFVVRAVSGALAIGVDASPWLVICTFFLALFLAVGKREATILYLGKKASGHRKVLEGYSKEITDFLLVISTTALILSYSLFASLSKQFEGRHTQLLLTVPISLYVILRFLYLIRSGSEIARNPEHSYRDIPLVIGCTIWVLTTLIIIYW